MSNSHIVFDGVNKLITVFNQDIEWKYIYTQWKIWSRSNGLKFELAFASDPHHTCEEGYVWVPQLINDWKMRWKV
jgi:hypothetical protein